MPIEILVIMAIIGIYAFSYLTASSVKSIVFFVKNNKWPVDYYWENVLLKKENQFLIQRNNDLIDENSSLKNDLKEEQNNLSEIVKTLISEK